MVFNTIHKGDNNDDVGTLQIALRGQDYKGKDGKPLTVDKSFGDNTDFALKNFQKDHGLSADGWCGPLSWPVVLGRK